MRRTLLWLLAATSLATACDQAREPTAPVESPSLAQDPAERTQVVRVEDTMPVFDPCFGETVLIEFHTQYVFSFRGDLTHGHLQYHEIDTGTTATGLTSGTVWRLPRTLNESANGDFTADDTPGEFTYAFHLELVRPGSPALRFADVVHVTVNANGTFTVTHEVFADPGC
jgi:hypothetical protein